MLNHATIKVMAAEKQKTESEAEHLKRAALFTASEHEVQRMEKKLQKPVTKAFYTLREILQIFRFWNQFFHVFVLFQSR